ncbi:MAG TPA: efflux RND transporter periplasmic adaptor subunit [Candidatus Deferrimicrobiaceae bacterium]|nr:efflux RND transporter periplasmic adaptor subunit [Candidatus Deferrimicrobiaceae bacterium]
MKLTTPEHEQERALHPEQPGGNGWRRRIGVERGRSGVLKLLMLALLVAAAAWAAYANLRNRPAMDMSMRVTSGNTPFPVVMARVERARIMGSVVYTGSVAAFNEEDVYPRVAGRIVEIPVYPGDAVRPGQVLARLDSVELSSKVGEAEAAVAAAQANRAQAEKELAAMVAEAGYARAVADRSAKLFAVGAVSRQESESDSAAAVAGEAKVEAARARLEAAASMQAQSAAMLRTATIVRDYVTIVASTPGYVVKRLVAPGVLVQPGMAILKVAQIDRVRLQANVGEKDLASIRVGSPVRVTTSAAGQSPLTVKVTSVFPFVDQGPRTAVVEALVDNAARRLLPGQYITMQFVTGERAAAVTVPAGAVTRMGGKATVWVEKDGRAEPRAVVTGLQNPERVEIAQGLEGDERVVTRGHEGLYAGARISDASSPGAAPPQAPAGKEDMPGMKEPTEAPTKPKEGSHAGH